MKLRTIIVYSNCFHFGGYTASLEKVYCFLLTGFSMPTKKVRKRGPFLLTMLEAEWVPFASLDSEGTPRGLRVAALPCEGRSTLKRLKH
jgi:hypothetical protein